jgi:hypothetical protein
LLGGSVRYWLLCGLLDVFLLGLMILDIGRGDLQGVEEESGAAEVDVVVADAGDDLAEGVLNGSAAGGLGELEGVAAGLTVVGVGDGFAGLVVVVAELLAAHGGGATALAVGQGVAALVLAPGIIAVLNLLDELLCVGHQALRTFLCKVFETGEMGGYFPFSAIKCESPAVGPGLLLSVFLF